MSHLNELLRPPPRHGTSLLVLGVFMVVVGGYFMFERMETVKSIAAIKIQTASLQQPRKPVPVPTRAELETQKRWNDIEVERQFRWYPLFAAIEQASAEDVELLEFEPDKAGGNVVLRGEARDIEALVEYLAALGRQRPFMAVHLTHQKQKARDGLTVISFEIQAALRQR